MAAAQVVQFRSGSTSPVAPSVSLSKSPRQLHSKTNNNKNNNNTMTSPSPTAVSPNNSTGIINGSSNSSTNYEGITALMLACQQGRVEDVQKILKKKV
jgi:ankyrin repeat protein